VSLRVEITLRILGSANARDAVVYAEHSKRVLVPYLRDDDPDQLAAATVELDGMVSEARDAISGQVADLVRQYREGDAPR
jgi:hypothetical protein